MKLTIAAIIATTLMTLFSILISIPSQDQYNEPVVLALLFGNFGTDGLSTAQLALGYVLHYVVGIAFGAAFLWLLKKYKLLPTFLTGMTYGFVAGIVGAIIWMLVIATHPDPPSIYYPMFYAQLIGAHMVFGISFAFTYRILTSKKKPLDTATRF